MSQQSTAVGAYIEKYDGEWSDNKMHGRGCYNYADGGCYDGMYTYKYVYACVYITAVVVAMLFGSSLILLFFYCHNNSIFS